MDGKSARDSGPAGAPAAPGQGHSEQSPVLAFLADPGSWSPRPERVDHVETHGAHVFMAGEQVLKIKRAVRYSYMDLSTLDRRKAACARELEVNSRFAPHLYLGLTPITRESDGGLRIGGPGEAVEWAVAMRRFEESAVLSRIARRGPLGAAPGALHLRSDLERKSLFGVGETDRLPAEAYTPEAGEAVYARLLSRAGTALKAGHSVIVDAVFADGGQRKAVETVARQAGAGFQALWLTVMPEAAASRISMRRGDASDATAEVAMAQMKRGAGDVTWQQLATDDGAEATFRRALALITPDAGNGTPAAET
jgi:predicted kinase